MDEHLPLDYLATCDVKLDPRDAWCDMKRLSMPKYMPELPEGMALVGQYVLEVMGIASHNPMLLPVIDETPLYYRMTDMPDDYRITMIYPTYCSVETNMSKVIDVSRILYGSPSALAHAQDVDCHGIVYTRDIKGRPGIWATSRALYALHHRINWVRGKYLSWNYVYYVCHLKAMGGFEIGLPEFDEKRLNHGAMRDLFHDILKYGNIPWQSGSCKRRGKNTKTIADHMYTHLPPDRFQRIQTLIHQLAGHDPVECISHMDVMRRMFPCTMKCISRWRGWGTLLILGHLYGLSDPTIRRPSSLVLSDDADTWISSKDLVHKEYDLHDVYAMSPLMK